MHFSSFHRLKEYMGTMLPRFILRATVPEMPIMETVATFALKETLFQSIGGGNSGDQ